MGQSGQLSSQRTITSQPVTLWPWVRKVRLSNSNSMRTPLPCVTRLADPPLRFTVREARRDALDHVAEFLGDHSEEEDHAIFIHRGVEQATEVQEGAILTTTFCGPRGNGRSRHGRLNCPGAAC